MSAKSIISAINIFKNFKLPHISRIINANIFNSALKISAAVFLSAFIVLNALFSLFSLPKDQISLLKNRIMSDPFSFTFHEQLAQAYLGYNLAYTEKEYLLAQYLFPKNTTQADQVLGTRSSPLQTWLNIKNYKGNIEEDISYWKTINEKFPDYLYAYLKQAYAYYNLGDKEKSLILLEKVLSFDPKNQNALFLLEKIKG